MEYDSLSFLQKGQCVMSSLVSELTSKFIEQ